MKNPVSTTMGSDPKPIRSACCIMSAEITGVAEQVSNRPAGQQGIVLDRFKTFLWRFLSGEISSMVSQIADGTIAEKAESPIRALVQEEARASELTNLLALAF